MVSSGAFRVDEVVTACFMMRVKMAFGSSLSSMDVDIMCSRV